MPDGLEKIQGEDKTAMRRVIITYYAEEEEAVAKMLGLGKIEKVQYDYKELGNENSI